MSRTLEYAVSYLLWMASSAAGVFEMITTHRVMGGIFALMSDSKWTRSALDQYSLVTLAVIGLGFVFFCENYYRKGVESGQLWRRFGIVTGAEAALFVCLTVGTFVV